MENQATVTVPALSASAPASASASASALGRRIPRRIGAVAAGFLTVAVLSSVVDAVLHASGVYPPFGQPMGGPLFLLALAYRSLFGALGGYVTARLAPDRPGRHARILGLIGTAVAILGAAVTWNRGPAFGPHWYPMALVVTSLPMVMLGARLRRGR